jgi:choline dehydrogenase-like flavoprotein
MGVNSLKVIDASSLPGQAPASRPMSLVYMIAEMAASNIIAEYSISANDFVIVGGGTAGCVLAARLCAGLPNAKIALLEAGTPRTDAQELIVRAPRNWADFTGGLIDRYVLSSAPIALIVGILASLFRWLL